MSQMNNSEELLDMLVNDSSTELLLSSEMPLSGAMGSNDVPKRRGKKESMKMTENEKLGSPNKPTLTNTQQKETPGDSDADLSLDLGGSSSQSPESASVEMRKGEPQRRPAFPIQLPSTDGAQKLTNFLETATNPLEWDFIKTPVRQLTLDNGDTISCIFWRGRFLISGPDVVKVAGYRLMACGGDIAKLVPHVARAKDSNWESQSLLSENESAGSKQKKGNVTTPTEVVSAVLQRKFEEGIFSDLRSLRGGFGSIVEETRSQLLQLLYSHHAVRSMKRQKVFLWTAVKHDRIFMDAYDREMRRSLGLLGGTVASSSPSNPQQESHSSEDASSSRKASSARGAGNSFHSATFNSQSSTEQPQDKHDRSISPRLASSTSSRSRSPLKPGSVFARTVPSTTFSNPNRLRWMRRLSNQNHVASNQSSFITNAVVMATSVTGSLSRNHPVAPFAETFSFTQPKGRVEYTAMAPPQQNNGEGEVDPSRRASMPLLMAPQPTFPTADVLLQQRPVESTFTMQQEWFDPNDSNQYHSSKRSLDVPVSNNHQQDPWYQTNQILEHGVFGSAQDNNQDFSGNSLLMSPTSNGFASSAFSRFDANEVAGSMNAMRIKTSPSQISPQTEAPQYVSLAAVTGEEITTGSQSQKRSHGDSMSRRKSQALSVESPVADQSETLNDYQQNRYFIKSPTAGSLSPFLVANAAAPPSGASLAQMPSAMGSVVGGPGADRQFMCGYPGCSRRFKRYEHLKRHYRTHTGEKPYKCSVPNCNKSFSRSDNLTQHMRIHASMAASHSIGSLSSGNSIEDFSSFGKSQMLLPIAHRRASTSSLSVHSRSSGSIRLPKPLAVHGIYIGGGSLGSAGGLYQHQLHALMQSPQTPNSPGGLFPGQGPYGNMQPTFAFDMNSNLFAQNPVLLSPSTELMSGILMHQGPSTDFHQSGDSIQAVDYSQLTSELHPLTMDRQLASSQGATSDSPVDGNPGMIL